MQGFLSNFEGGGEIHTAQTHREHTPSDKDLTVTVHLWFTLEHVRNVVANMWGRVPPNSKNSIVTISKRYKDVIGD